MIEQFKAIHENRHNYAQEWQKKTGGKVLGYFCTYVPEEILYAANVLPVRILGSHEPQDVTEPHIFGMFCPFCRDCLAQGLKGRYDYLNGIMIAQSCLHIRQAFTSWKKHIPREFAYYLPMPHHVQSPSSEPYLRAEYEKFKIAVEEWTGDKIADDKLKNAIDIYNRNRQLLRELYKLREQDNPPLTGEDVMHVILATQMGDKAEVNNLLEELISKCKDNNPERECGERLMIVGSEDDDIPFIHMVESLNSTIVADDHCTGTRYFWNSTEVNGDLLGSLAKRYIDRPPCPTKDWPKRTRFPHILNMAKAAKVDGIIIIQQKFCDPHECDIPPLTNYLKENGFKTLFLEFDVTVPMGQFRIRTEAFLEMLREEDLF